MKNISREDILRMIGLRDSAGLMSKINSLMVDMYSEDGKLAEYSTQIIQTSKNITLLAQRVTDTETGIADLTIEYNSISATVSSVQETVNGHTTQIGQLVVRDNEISLSVSSLRTDVDTNTGNIATNTSSISTLTQTANSISGRVTVIEGDYVTSADLNLYVDKDMVSWLTGSANNVVFNFSNAFQIQSNGTAVATLNSSGDLTILGALIENSTAEALDIRGNSTMSYISGGSTVDGIRCTSSGVQRWSTIFNRWIPLYSQRFCRPLTYTSESSKTLYNDDDYLLSYGNYKKTLVLPPSPSDGKVITVANITNITYIKPNTGQTLNYGGTIVQPTDEGQPLHDYDLAELVYYLGVWYWHYMEI